MLHRIVPQFSLFAVLAGAGVALGAWAPAHADDEPEPCTTKDFEFDVVEKACKEGGQDAAKKLMKKIVKKAKKETGEKVKCKHCHKSIKTFELKDNAVEDLKKLL